MSVGKHRLGKLECSGSFSFNQAPTSCQDLKKEGHNLNGVYTVRGQNGVKSVFCDMSKQTEEQGLETVLDQKVFFQVYNFLSDLTGSPNQDPVMTFQMELANVGNSINSTNGTFTTPVQGVYLFSVQGRANDKYDAQLRLMKNEEEISSTSAVEGHDFTITSIVTLRAGDLIQIKQDDRDFYSEYNYSHQTSFTGSLLHGVALSKREFCNRTKREPDK